MNNKEKLAKIAKAYSAGDIKLGLIVGRYPSGV
jgi:hypothetical protein